MRKKSKIFITSLSALALGLFLTGCGKNNLREKIAANNTAKENTTTTVTP